VPPVLSSFPCHPSMLSNPFFPRTNVCFNVRLSPTPPSQYQLFANGSPLWLPLPLRPSTQKPAGAPPPSSFLCFEVPQRLLQLILFSSRYFLEPYAPSSSLRCPMHVLSFGALLTFPNNTWSFLTRCSLPPPDGRLLLSPLSCSLSYRA